MEQRIFEQGLSVEATSLYLLIQGLSDGGAVLDRDEVSRFWNSEPQALDQAFAELVSRAIAGSDETGHWFLRPHAEWRKP